MPTHTAYAVPAGSDFIAMLSRAMLTTIAARVPTLGHNRENPLEYFSPMAQPISSNPAITRMSQFTS
jgi:hypothetical protein